MYEATGAMVWMIIPSLVEAAGCAAGWSGEFGQTVVSKVLRILSLRRIRHVRNISITCIHQAIAGS
jgi:hypothetical protein